MLRRQKINLNAFTALHVHFSASQKRTQPRYHFTLHKTTASSPGSTKAEVVPWSNGALTSSPAHHNVPQCQQQQQQRSNVPAALKLNPKHLRGVSVSPATLEDPTVT